MVLTKLKKIMDDKDLSSEALAVITLLSARSIDKARAGKGISLNTGKRIAKGLKMKPEELV
jgi:DNA-binding Xre family transcriptional regulator